MLKLYPFVPGSLLAAALLSLTTLPAHATEPVIAYVADIPTDYQVILDVGPAAACRSASLPAARCLPAAAFLGPHRGLANVSGILWLLGTAGLTGSEHILLVGGGIENREFMAGLLYLTGQARVSVVTRSLGDISADIPKAPGLIHSKTREKVYQVPMRDDRVLLRGELATLLRTDDPPLLLDGRSEREYWGQRVRALRGGHLPGAQHFPAANLRPEQGLDTGQQWLLGRSPVLYGHDAYQGLVFLSRVVALAIDARVYPEGWSDWASDGSLPADSLTLPDWSKLTAGRVASKRVDTALSPRLLVVLLVCASLIALAGFWLGRALEQRRSG